MMKKFAFFFPGQGSQSLGMMESFKDIPEVKPTFLEASEVLGFDLWELVSRGPEEKLNQTEFTQPAILTASIACWRVWKARGLPMPVIMAGHSLGEYSALVASEAIALKDAVKLVALRGRYMQQACPAGVGAMAAIIGLSDEMIEEVCREASNAGTVSPANYNSPGQVVIAGEAKAVDRALELARAKNATLARLIPVSVASHCALMKPAAEKLAGILSSLELFTPKIQVIHNVDVQSHDSAEAIRRALTQQLFMPVRWVQTVQHCFNQGITLAYEAAPGKVLTGLCKRIEKQLTVFPLFNLENFK